VSYYLLKRIRDMENTSKEKERRGRIHILIWRACLMRGK
jgi:hypothetical protein